MAAARAPTLRCYAAPTVSCRTHSNSTTAAAAAALSDSTSPGHRDREAVARDIEHRRREPSAFVADRNCQRPGELRAIEIDTALAHRRHDASAARTERARPRGQVNVLVHRQVEVRAHAGAQDFRRPGERAMRRQERMRDAGGGGGAQHRADVARILHVVEQQAESPRRRPPQAWACRRRRAFRHRPAARRSRRTAAPARRACAHRNARRDAVRRVARETIRSRAACRAPRSAAHRLRSGARPRARTCRPCGDHATRRRGVSPP